MLALRRPSALPLGGEVQRAVGDLVGKGEIVTHPANFADQRGTIRAFRVMST
jgi:hypothetical protein